MKQLLIILGISVLAFGMQSCSKETLPTDLPNISTSFVDLVTEEQRSASASGPCFLISRIEQMVMSNVNTAINDLTETYSLTGSYNSQPGEVSISITVDKDFSGNTIYLFENGSTNVMKIPLLNGFLTSTNPDGSRNYDLLFCHNAANSFTTSITAVITDGNDRSNIVSESIIIQ